MKSKLKAPGTKRLKLNYKEVVSTLVQFCFQIQLAPLHRGVHLQDDRVRHRAGGERARLPGRAVQVDPIKPTLKAPGTKRFDTKM